MADQRGKVERLEEKVRKAEAAERDRSSMEKEDIVAQIKEYQVVHGAVSGEVGILFRAVEFLLGIDVDEKKRLSLSDLRRGSGITPDQTTAERFRKAGFEPTDAAKAREDLAEARREEAEESEEGSEVATPEGNR